MQIYNKNITCKLFSCFFLVPNSIFESFFNIF